MKKKILKLLWPTQQNLLLTGDPVFAFDPMACEAVLFKNVVEPELLQQFDYLLRQHRQPSLCKCQHHRRQGGNRSHTQRPKKSLSETLMQHQYNTKTLKQPKQALRSISIAHGPTYNGCNLRHRLQLPISSSARRHPDGNSSKNAQKRWRRTYLRSPPPGWRLPHNQPCPSAIRKPAAKILDKILNLLPPWFKQPIPKRAAPALPKQKPEALSYINPKISICEFDKICKFKFIK